MYSTVGLSLLYIAWSWTIYSLQCALALALERIDVESVLHSINMFAERCHGPEGIGVMCYCVMQLLINIQYSTIIIKCKRLSGAFWPYSTYIRTRAHLTTLYCISLCCSLHIPTQPLSGVTAFNRRSTDKGVLASCN